MNTRLLTTAVMGLFLGAFGGFFLANSINRTEINELRGKVEQNKSKPGSSNSDSAAGDGLFIGDDELKAKIAQADANPDNFEYQKNLGGALYRYASMKNDRAMANEARRILIRANSLDPRNYDVIVDLGNAYFDTGYFGKDSDSFAKARDLYTQALASKPADADVRTDLAISFVLDNPPNYARAADEFQKALAADPKHERALQFLSQTYMLQNNWTDAGKILDRLKTANPKNERIKDLTTQLTNKQAEPFK